jgi:hypothetical protein
MIQNTKIPPEIKDLIKEIIAEEKEQIKHYLFVRDKDGYIKEEHRVIWERNFGKIPPGMIIHHINGNKKDNSIENLILVSIKEHGNLHKKPNKIRITYKSGAVKVLPIFQHIIEGVKATLT